MKSIGYRILICLLFLSPALLSQTKIDSLNLVLKTLGQDSTRVKTLAILVSELNVTDEFGKAKVLAKEAIALSQKCNYTKNIDNLYYKMGISCVYLEEYDEAIANFKRSILLKKQAGKKESGDVYIYLGSIYTMKGDNGLALQNDFIALEIKKELKDRLGIKSLYNNISILYFNLSNYPEALRYNLLSLKLYEEDKDQAGIAAQLNNIGNIYEQQGDFTKAMEKQMLALKMRKEIGNESAIALSYTNIGNLYVRQGRYKEALDNFNIVFNIQTNLKGQRELANAHNNLGVVYDYMNEPALAIQNYTKALKIHRELGEAEGIADSHLNLGEIYLHSLKKYKAAQIFLDSALYYSKLVGSLDDLKMVYAALSELDSINHNPAGALKNYKLYIAYNDRINNEENTKKIVQQQMNYEFEKKEGETKALQDQKDFIAGKEKQEQKIITASVSVGLIMVLVLAIVIFRSLRLNQNKNKIITAQKLEVEHQKHIIEEKQKEIIDSIRYAQRIQKALMPNEKYFEKNIRGKRTL